MQALTGHRQSGGVCPLSFLRLRCNVELMARNDRTVRSCTSWLFLKWPECHFHWSMRSIRLVTLFPSFVGRR